MSNLVHTTRTEEEIAKDAASQIEAEISSETAPLEARVGTIDAREETARSALQTMFGSIMPYVEGAVGAVRGAHESAQAQRQRIFNEANQRLSALQQERSQRAQAMAQEIGGPVAISEFEASVAPAREALARYEPTSLLHGATNMEIGVQEAAAFSGRVFPLVRTEQEAQQRRFFQEQRTEIESQIDAIKASKTGRTNKRLNELLLAEREFALAQNAQALDRVKANRDWQATRASLANERERLRLARQQFGLDTRRVNAEIANLTAQQKLEARRLNISELELAARIAEATAEGKQKAQERQIDLQEQAMELIEGALNPGSRNVTRNVRVEIPASKGYTTDGAYKIGKKWYVDKKVTETVQTVAPMTDPQKLYEYLVGYKIPKAMAQNLVRTRLGVPSFIPGKVNYTRPQLEEMPFRQLRGVAMQLGFTPNPKDPKTRKQLVDFVVGRLR